MTLPPNMLTALQYGNLHSEDKKTAVGALLARGYKQIAYGANKLVLPVEDFWSAAKYPRIVHAEIDCLVNFLRMQVPVEPLKNLQLYVTLEPCSECCKFIIFTRKYTNIDKVYVWNRRSEGSGVHLLLESSIQVEFVEGVAYEEQF